MVVLTERMKAWIETGCILNVATKVGVPTVTLCKNVKVTADDEVVFHMTSDELSVINAPLAENNWVAFGITKVGGIRACYQFKGKGTLAGTDLTVKLSEVYCTKPGAEAGCRLDVMPPEKLALWDKQRWKDMPKKA